MTRLHPEPLLFCAAWAALALAGGIWGNWWIAVLLSVGLLLLISAASLQILTRTEDMQAAPQSRGQVQYAELGCRRDGTFTGLRVRLVGDAGAYPNIGAWLPGGTRFRGEVLSQGHGE